MTTQPSEPIRIMNIIARLNVGGPAIHVSLITARIGPPDYHSTLVCGQIGPEEGDMQYFAEAQGVQPVIIPELGRSLHPVRDLATLWKLYRLIRRFRPDVVHTHTAKAGFVGRVAAWLAGVPVIVHTFHGHVFHGYFGPSRTRLFLLLERLTARMSGAIITLTDSLAAELSHTYRIAPREKFRVQGLALHLDPYVQMPRKSGDFRAQWGIPPDVPLVGIVGRLVPVKNHALFVAAAARIRAALPDAHFVIIGDGETRPAVEAQLEALGLHNSVTITGWQRDLAAAYSDLDVMVISSVNEGTPVTVIEALAGRCPVVATAVGGLPDLLSGGALGALVPSGDVEALAGAVIQTLQNPPDMDRAQAAILERYSLDRLVETLTALYRELLARR